MKAKISLIIIFAVVMLTGCTGYRESTGTYIVSAIGFDKGEQGFKINVQVVSLGGDSPEGRVFSAQAATPTDALYSVITKIEKTAVFDHCGIVAVGKNVIGRDLERVFDFCSEERSLNLSVYVILCEDTESLLSVKTKSAATSGYALMEIIENYRKQTGIDLNNRFYELQTLMMRQDKVFSLPIFTPSNEDIELQGRGIYRDWQYLMSVNNEEGIVYSLLCNNVDSGGQLIIGNNSIMASSMHTALSLNDNDISLSIKTKISATGDTNNFANALTDNVNALINRARSEKVGDIFGFSERIYLRNRGLWNEIKNDYNDMFNTGDIGINYSAGQVIT